MSNKYDEELKEAREAAWALCPASRSRSAWYSSSAAVSASHSYSASYSASYSSSASYSAAAAAWASAEELESQINKVLEILE